MSNLDTFNKVEISTSQMPENEVLPAQMTENKVILKSRNKYKTVYRTAQILIFKCFIFTSCYWRGGAYRTTHKRPENNLKNT